MNRIRRRILEQIVIQYLKIICQFDHFLKFVNISSHYAFLLVCLDWQLWELIFVKQRVKQKSPWQNFFHVQVDSF